MNCISNIYKSHLKKDIPLDLRVKNFWCFRNDSNKVIFYGFDSKPFYFELDVPTAKLWFKLENIERDETFKNVLKKLIYNNIATKINIDV